MSATQSHPTATRATRQPSRAFLVAWRQRLVTLLASLAAAWRAVAGVLGHPVPPSGRTGPARTPPDRV